MVAPIKSKTIDALFRSFNIRFPNRDKESDGWISDTRHSTTKTGHNPDDYPLPAGGSAEYEDSDNVPEVRAADIDRDLRDPISMQQVWDACIKDPEFRARFRYVIFNKRIASRNNGWVWKPYFGDNPHDKHGHASAGPESDENSSLFDVILNIGDNMAHDPLDESDVAAVSGGVAKTLNQRFGFPVGPTGGPAPVDWSNVVVQINGIKSTLDALVAVSFTDEDAAQLRADIEAAQQEAQAKLDTLAVSVDQVDDRVIEGLQGLVPATLAQTIKGGMTPEGWAEFVQSVQNLAQEEEA